MPQGMSEKTPQEIPSETPKKRAIKKKTASQSAVNYEEAFTELEQLVNSLEDAELPLEQALANFEKGIKLTNQCQKALSEAEQKVEVLMQQSDS